MKDTTKSDMPKKLPKASNKIGVLKLQQANTFVGKASRRDITFDDSDSQDEDEKRLGSACYSLHEK